MAGVDNGPAFKLLSADHEISIAHPVGGAGAVFLLPDIKNSAGDIGFGGPRGVCRRQHHLRRADF